jgi:hypothetical protein
MTSRRLLHLDNTELSGKMNDELENIWKEAVVDVLSRPLPERTEEAHEKPHLRWPVFRSRFGHDISPIQARIFTV